MYRLLLSQQYKEQMMIFSGILGVVIGLFLEVIFFSVDYSRTENVQFEDDEYYYYVKAVPKVGVQMPEKQVKHITEHQGQDAEMPNVSETENNTALSITLFSLHSDPDPVPCSDFLLKEYLPSCLNH